MGDTILGLIVTGGVTAIVLIAVLCLVIIAYRMNEVVTLLDNIEYRLEHSNDPE